MYLCNYLILDLLLKNGGELNNSYPFFIRTEWGKAYISVGTTISRKCSAKHSLQGKGT